MLKRIILLSLLLLLAACGGNAILSENFTNLTELPAILQPDMLVAAPDAQNDVLHLIVTETGTTQSGWLRIQLEPDKTEYEVTARVKVISGSLRLWARTNPDECGGYALILDPIRDNYRLSTVDKDTCALRTLDSRAQLAVQNDLWYEMQIIVRDGLVSAFVDGVKYFEAEASTFPDGGPALEVVNDRTDVGQVDIDSLIVK